MIEKVYPATENAEQALFDALYGILQTTPIDKVTVSRLLQEAHVSKSGFYRRYRDKYDLLNRSYEKILEKTLFTFNEGNSWRDSVCRIYEVIGDNREFFNNAFHSEDCNSLSNYIYSCSLQLEKAVLRDHGIDPEDRENSYRLIGYVSGALEITRRWVEDKEQLPLERLVDILVEMVPDPFRQYFV